jgi:hypothetical protein
MRHRLVLALVAFFPAVLGCGQRDAQPDAALRQERYRKVVDRLNATVGAERDERLCNALATILNELAAGNNSNVYVAVTDTAGTIDAAEAAVEIAKWKNHYEFRGREPEVLPEDVIFGADSAAPRAKRLLEQLQAALRTVADDSFMKLELLPADASREGRIIIDVRAAHVPGPVYAMVRLANAPYLLREFHVDLEAKFFNRQGEALAVVTASTQPGTLHTRVESGTWQYADPKGKLQYLGNLASWSQLESTYAKFAQIIEKKFGSEPK